jgi:predicted nucleic acid-binding protein
MKDPVIVDTGPVVAALNRREQHHAWAREQFGLISAPALTCEAVVSECCFLLRHVDSGVDALMQLLRRGVVAVTFTLSEEQPAVARLLKRYRSVPMSLADACLVRMAELHSESPVLTLDGDFSIFRKNGRQVIPLVTPGVS